MLEVILVERDSTTSELVKETTIAKVVDLDILNFILTALKQTYGDIPSYSFEVRNLDGERPLTHEERVAWFVANYYETGMELEGMIKALRGKDLDNFNWRGETISFPKTFSELGIMQ